MTYPPPAPFPPADVPPSQLDVHELPASWREKGSTLRRDWGLMLYAEVWDECADQLEAALQRKAGTTMNWPPAGLETKLDVLDKLTALIRQDVQKL